MIELMHGDCLELMTSIPDGSVDAIICDLPYGTTACKWDTVIPLEPLWEQYKRICKGAIVLTAQPPFDKRLGASNLGALKYEWIWRKSKPTGHLNAKLQPMKEHENVLVFYEKQPTYNPQGLVKKPVPTIRKGGNTGRTTASRTRTRFRNSRTTRAQCSTSPAKARPFTPPRSPWRSWST